MYAAVLQFTGFSVTKLGRLTQVKSHNYTKNLIQNKTDLSESTF